MRRFVVDFVLFWRWQMRLARFLLLLCTAPLLQACPGGEHSSRTNPFPPDPGYSAAAKACQTIAAETATTTDASRSIRRYSCTNADYDSALDKVAASTLLTNDPHVGVTVQMQLDWVRHSAYPPTP